MENTLHAAIATVHRWARLNDQPILGGDVRLVNQPTIDKKKKMC